MLLASKLWKVGITTIFFAVTIGASSIQAKNLKVFPVTIKPNISTAWIYDGGEDGAFNKDDKFSILHNRQNGKVFTVLKETKNAEPCPNQLGYLIEDIGWLCASVFNRDVQQEAEHEPKQPQAVQHEPKQPQAVQKVQDEQATQRQISEEKHWLSKQQGNGQDADQGNGQDADQGNGQDFFDNIDTEAKTQRETSSNPAKKVQESAKPAKNNAVDERYAGIRDKINADDRQEIYPDKRTFITLSRNYMNRIHCPGHISWVGTPSNRDVEITPDKEHNPQNLFIKLGEDLPSTFILDLFPVCDGLVYEINAAVDAALPSQTVVLSKKDEQSPRIDLSDHQDAINVAEALPMEDQITRILTRVYKNDHMGFWQTTGTPEKRRIITNISNLEVIDVFLKPGQDYMDAIHNLRTGRVVAYGKTVLEQGIRLLILEQTDEHR